MRLFHALVFDQYLEGSGFAALYKANEAWTLLLTKAETLKFFCVADTVSGTSPTLTAKLHGTSTAAYNTEDFEDTKVLFNAAALSTGTNTLTATYSDQDTTSPAPGHLFLNVFLNGTGPRAHVRLWVCGRGFQLLGAVVPATPAFAAQYAAARLIDDEDKLPIRKRVRKLGAGSALPDPDLFDPSLTWEH